MSTNSVSCIIPVYNGEKYLGESIESVLQQTSPVSEVLVIDDGSTDGTADLVRSFGGIVRLISQENAGPAAARNTGLANATGMFITFQDGDDLWALEKTALQLAAFAQDAELMICTGHVENFNSPDVDDEDHLPNFEARAKPMAGYTTPAMMARREVFNTVGNFNASLKHTDAGEWFKRARGLKVRELLLPETIVHRRLHVTNRSRVHAEESRAEFLAMLKAGLDTRRKTNAETA